MALGDQDTLKELLRRKPRKAAIMHVVVEYHWDQERLVNALREYGLPTRSRGNRVYFYLYEAFVSAGVRQAAEHFSDDKNFDFVEF